MIEAPSIQSLSTLYEALRTQSLVALFEADLQRAERFSCEVDQLYLDYSKHFITEAVRDHLVQWAEDLELRHTLSCFLKGTFVNPTENCPVTHPLWRRPFSLSPIAETKTQMAEMVFSLQQGKWRGVTQKPFTHVVNIGIGGSDMGSKMATEALYFYKQSPFEVHFLSNGDPQAMARLRALLPPETTLFIVSSKSFATMETCSNAESAKAWLAQHLDYPLEAILEKHFVAITAHPEKALAWGISRAHVLSFEASVVGRYSIWSPVGFPLALSIGMEHWEQFLAGGYAMDRHLEEAPFLSNMPVLLALLGIWYIHFWGAKTLAILPYDYGLRYLPEYLQQLDMESNGKGVTQEGQRVTYATAPIVWGQVGTNAQHAFYQLLHQGTHLVPMDFILSAQGHTSAIDSHQALIAHCLVQAQTFMRGSMLVGDLPQAHLPGNKPSSVLLLSKLTPYALGQLLALYEHKVIIQSLFWQVNAFDQPGVDQGKRWLEKMRGCLVHKQEIEAHDASTRTLIQKVQSFQKRVI